eukprot:Gb_38451 [translate_table: standard]
MADAKEIKGKEHHDSPNDFDAHCETEESSAELNNKEVGQQTEEQQIPSPQEEEAIIKKKYGGLLPKKPPLITKDHERAFFDSADWALGKQGAPLGQRPKGPIEALRPKLQPTPHQPLPARRSAYATPEGEDGGMSSPNEAMYHESGNH